LRRLELPVAQLSEAIADTAGSVFNPSPRCSYTAFEPFPDARGVVELLAFGVAVGVAVDAAVGVLITGSSLSHNSLLLSSTSGCSELCFFSTLKILTRRALSESADSVWVPLTWVATRVCWLESLLEDRFGSSRAEIGVLSVWVALLVLEMTPSLAGGGGEAAGRSISGLGISSVLSVCVALQDLCSTTGAGGGEAAGFDGKPAIFSLEVRASVVLLASAFKAESSATRACVAVTCFLCKRIPS